MSRLCAIHGATEAATRCAACGTMMCEACFRFFVAEKPSCVRCAHEVATRSRRRTSLAMFVGLVALGLGGVLHTRADSTTWQAIAYVTALLGLVTGVLLNRSGHESAGPSMRERRPSEPPPHTEGRAPRRAAALRRRLVTALGPRLSARATALTALCAMALTAVSFPALLGLPRWLELELVLGLWWLMATPAFALLLYRGFHIDDDHFFHAPRAPDAPPLRKVADGCDASGCDVAGCDAVGCDEGAMIVVVPFVALLLLGAAVAVAWMLVEVVLPVAFLAFYLGALAALKRVGRDRHDCRHDALRSLGWGALWASLFLVPIAGTIWLLHALARPG